MLLKDPIYYYSRIREHYKNSYLAEDTLQVIIGIDCEYVDSYEHNYKSLEQFYKSQKSIAPFAGLFGTFAYETIHYFEKIDEIEKNEPVSADRQEQEKADAVKFLTDVFKAMKLEAAINVEFDSAENELTIDVKAEDMGVLIGKRGQTLDSLQYILSLVVNKNSESYIRIKLDTENYRKKRKDKLEILAKNIAAKVKKTGKFTELEPMNAYERRIIHAALQGDNMVSTKSVGEEPFRHITVYPKKNFKQNRRSPKREIQ